MRIEDIILILISIAAIVLMIFMVLTLSRERSPEYVTYKDFREFEYRMYTINIAFYGLMLSSMFTLWYKIGRLESPRRKYKSFPEEFY